MTDDYLDNFIRESEENIVKLNNSLLDLEDDPANREAVDLIFRTAHTLKGNFGAMGFDRAAALAHAIEDLLDEIRAERMQVSPDLMDLVFTGVDELESVLAEIEATGEASVDPSESIQALREAIETGADAVTDGETAVAHGEGKDDVTGGIDQFISNVDPADIEGNLYRVSVTLTEGDMKSVDGMLVLEAVEGAFVLHGCVPSRSTIEEGEFDTGFDLLIDANETDDVDAFFADLSKVKAADVEPMEFNPVESAAQNSVGSPDDIKSIRVDVGELDDLYSLVEQLVTSRIKLRRSIQEMDRYSASENLDELDKLTASLQDTVMDMRLIPLGKVVDTFPRLVRDLARSQEKEVNFEMEETDIELDRTILDEISDPLMHILRNAVDHGIESPDERELAGKPREGRIHLRASRQRDFVDIVVEDDGAGLDPGHLRRRAVNNGVLTEEEIDAMDDDAVYDLIFHPGLSTAEEVTDVSGRGVGMDIVRSTVERLDGSVSVSSEPGKGTSITLRLPVTVAIVRVLFIEVGDREFGIPVKAIDEITQVRALETVNGEPVIEHNDSIYPVLNLREELTDSAPTQNGEGMLLRVNQTTRPVALQCDAVDRLEEVVIKPLEGELKNIKGVSGTAVVGDGKIVPIIDVSSL